MKVEVIVGRGRGGRLVREEEERGGGGWLVEKKMVGRSSAITVDGIGEEQLLVLFFIVKDGGRVERGVGG